VQVTYVGPVPPIRGGISQHGSRLIEGLRDEGHAVDVISWKAQYPVVLYGRRQEDPDAEPFAGARFALRWWDPISWWRAGRAARRTDLLVLQWVTPFHAVPLRVLLAAAGKTPAVVVVHNPLPHEKMPLTRPLTRLVLSRVTGALVHADSAARDLAALVSLRRIVSVPMPPILRVGRTALPPRPPLRLLFLGFVRPYKGVDTAIDAVRALIERGHAVELTVAGEVWDGKGEWAAKLRASGAVDGVHLRPGYVSDAEVAELLSSHHALVAPYRSATQSGVVPIAFAAGRPVVATAVGGLPERVVEGETGALSPPGDAESFAAAIERVEASLDELAAAVAPRAGTWAEVARGLLRACGQGE
jgi:glycosyltransferase involved in cell wall biosynthesis